MGFLAFDQYSLLHFATGIVVYFWNISLLHSVVIHILFEYIENTLIGMNIINNYITFWPGGKPYSDTIINSVFDTIFFAIGWILANQLDRWSSEHHLYSNKI